MQENIEISKLRNVILSGRVIIGSHQNPDGDAIGASLGLALSLETVGMKPIVLLKGYAKKYEGLPGTELVYRGGYSDLSGDIFISVDCASKERMNPEDAQVFDRIPVTVNIDHHESNTLFAQNNYVVAESASTCELIFRIVKDSETFKNRSKDIATLLSIGVLSDTGGLRHKNTMPETFENMASLARYGADLSLIQREILNSHSIAEAKAFCRALNNINLIENGSVAVTYLTHNDFTSAGAEYSDVDGIAEYMLEIEGVKVSVLFSERDNGIVKASMRSAGISVAKVAGSFGGGGHFGAAGASLADSLDSAMERVINRIKEEMRQEI